MFEPWAHAPPGGQAGAPHLLADHLAGTTRLAASFLPSGLDENWAHIPAFFHDLGKASEEWQGFIRQAVGEAAEAHVESEGSVSQKKAKGPSHSPEGALRLLLEAGGGDVQAGLKDYRALALAWIVFGHHGGLKDHEGLKARLLAISESWVREASVDAFLMTSPGHSPLPSLPPWVKECKTKEEGQRRIDLFVRMLFSVLVDADFLDTEGYFASIGHSEAQAKVDTRRGEYPSLLEIYSLLESRFSELDARSNQEPDSSARAINVLRFRVREACLHAAAMPQGLFTLTVPTGGAKTLGSLAFALKHAMRHGKKRVIVAVPFTSVTEQTAAVFRSYLPPMAVLEHHSNLDPSKETARSRVASENWDAPVIVTTQVQLFESLLANRSSRCRKLHNICEAVLILDEVQSLPYPYLLTILDLLDDLARNYGTTVLLTTATQPELYTRELGGQIFRGLSQRPQEIIPGPLADDLWTALRRVRVYWPNDWGGDFKESPEPWAQLATHLLAHRQALAITHLKMDALELSRALVKVGLRPLHLSTSMCAAHRRRVLASAMDRLDRGEPCHLVSTQLIEAGVDVDFPVVYRAMAGLEALAQSAGRCNRNGCIQGLGDFYIYEAPTEPPRDLRLCRDVARSMLLNGAPDLLAPATYTDYFSRLHAARGNLLDIHGLQADRADLKFEQVAEKTRLVDTPGDPVFVPYDEAAQDAIDALRRFGPTKRTLRALQPFSVSLFPRQLQSLLAMGALEPVHGFHLLVSSTNYHPDFGVHTEADPAQALVF